MAGGSRRHNALASRISAALEATRPTGCTAFQSDQRIRVLATGLATYPDASMTCGVIEGDPADRGGDTITNPTLLVEVLSPSTEFADSSGSSTSSSRRYRSTFWSARPTRASRSTAAMARMDGSTSTFAREA
jgi:Uma2 family endonuclease